MLVFLRRKFASVLSLWIERGLSGEEFQRFFLQKAEVPGGSCGALFAKGGFARRELRLGA